MIRYIRIYNYVSYNSSEFFFEVSKTWISNELKDDDGLQMIFF